MKKNKYNFEPEVCDCCGQAKTYLLPIDFGTALIVKAFSKFIQLKGINMVHPTKEMEVLGNAWTYDLAMSHGLLTSTQIGNFTRARAHGLIARHKDEPGNWVLTAKGARFLRGERIPKLALMRKSRVDDGIGYTSASHKEEYFKPNEYTTTIHEVKSKDHPGMWEGISFDIVEGQIIEN